MLDAPEKTLHFPGADLSPGELHWLRITEPDLRLNQPFPGGTGVAEYLLGLLEQLLVANQAFRFTARDFSLRFSAVQRGTLHSEECGDFFERQVQRVLETFHCAKAETGLNLTDLLLNRQRGRLSNCGGSHNVSSETI